MPVSHRYKAIFIHIPKTAGTSIYTVLSIPQNEHHFYSAAKRIPSYQHLTPTQLQRKLPPKIWNQYYKFTVVRNPFDRAVSDYRYLKKHLPAKYRITSFVAFLHLVERIVKGNKYTENVYFDHFRPQSHYFQGITYDKICKFESLHTDLDEVKQKLQCHAKQLPWKYKTSTVHGPSNYLPYYTHETKSIIERLYAEDLKKFNYCYEGSTPPEPQNLKSKTLSSTAMSSATKFPPRSVPHKQAPSPARTQRDEKKPKPRKPFAMIRKRSAGVIHSNNNQNNKNKVHNFIDITHQKNR